MSSLEVRRFHAWLDLLAPLVAPVVAGGEAGQEEPGDEGPDGRRPQGVRQARPGVAEDAADRLPGGGRKTRHPGQEGHAHEERRRVNSQAGPHAAEGDHDAAEHRAEHFPGLAETGEHGVRRRKVLVVDQRRDGAEARGLRDGDDGGLDQQESQQRRQGRQPDHRHDEHEALPQLPAGQDEALVDPVGHGPGQRAQQPGERCDQEEQGHSRAGPRLRLDVQDQGQAADPVAHQGHGPGAGQGGEGRRARQHSERAIAAHRPSFPRWDARLDSSAYLRRFSSCPIWPSWPCRVGRVAPARRDVGGLPVSPPTCTGHTRSGFPATSGGCSPTRPRPRWSRR